jgi:hypothetical protein
LVAVGVVVGADVSDVGMVGPMVVGAVVMSGLDCSRLSFIARSETIAAITSPLAAMAAYQRPRWGERPATGAMSAPYGPERGSVTAS